MSCLVGYKTGTGWDGRERRDWWIRGGDPHKGRDRARESERERESEKRERARESAREREREKRERARESARERERERERAHPTRRKITHQNIQPIRIKIAH